MDINEYISKLKSVVRRTEPDCAGHWERHLTASRFEFDMYIRSLCHSFLTADVLKRREYEIQLNDDDVLWFLQEFIDIQVAAINKYSDTEPLLLGLAAVAMLGPHSDPRDVTIWLHDLYYAAVLANVSERKQFCIQVGKLASTKWGVADQIRLFPERHEISLAKRAAIEHEGHYKKRSLYDGCGLTPLMRAVLDGNKQEVINHISNGADVNATIRGASALAFAAFAGRQEIVELLLSLGARVDVHPFGESLLQYTNFVEKHPEITDILKKAGAS